MNPLTPILLPAILGGGLLRDPNLSDAPSRARSPSPPAAGMTGSTGSLRRAELSFRDYIRLLSLFHPNHSVSERAAFLFRLFNLSDDGCLREGEMRTILAAMVGDNLTEAEISGLVQAQFSQLDQDHDGMVSASDFEMHLGRAIRKATISI